MEKEKEINTAEKEEEVREVPEVFYEDEPDERDYEIRRLILENESLRRKEAERILENDLAKVRKLDPKVRRIEDLGEVFIALRAGGVPCEEAYKAVFALNSKKEVTQMGDIFAEAGEQDYFTPEEVKNMTSEEVKKNYEKIRKSMSKWKA